MEHTTINKLTTNQIDVLGEYTKKRSTMIDELTAAGTTRLLTYQTTRVLLKCTILCVDDKEVGVWVEDALEPGRLVDCNYCLSRQLFPANETPLLVPGYIFYDIAVDAVDDNGLHYMLQYHEFLGTYVSPDRLGELRDKATLVRDSFAARA